ncbi:TolC family protein [Candidatus Nitrotoga sp. M5]|uniref:TolC family protein n=1 Tax=Candidatus Nitrotoga sp. M5 TaxID=2890409 RepID=UPI001EF256CF|nr:TolC family protein [Candidatus Nitrotoga sp. M5]
MQNLIKNFLRAWLLASLLAQIGLAAAEDSLLLEDAVTLAVAGNSGLAKIGARARALAEVPSQVGTLPDPTLSLNALNLPTDTFSRSQEAMTQMQIGIAQTLPFPGKLGLREEAAQFDAAAAEWDTLETRLVVIRNVRMTWWNLFYLDRAIFIARQNQVLLRQFVKIAEIKYKTGQGLQSDVLLAQVELSKLLDVEISLQASRRGQAAQMNALLNRPANMQVKLPQEANELLPDYPDIAPLRKLALDTRPTLSAQRSQLDAAHTRVNLAEKDYYPDFKLGAAYGARNGSNPNGSARADFTSIMFSMNLPIYTGKKQDRALAQRKAEVVKEKFSLEDRVVQVDTEIEQALADYRAGHDQASLFKTGIIPQASMTVSSMLAAYQVNKVDFLNLVRSQITLYNYETQYWKALSSGWQAWARLEAAVGTTIPRNYALKTDQGRAHE